MSKVDDFIARWSIAGGNERTNAIPFLNELCDIIGVEKPQPAMKTSANDDYRFERYIRSEHFGESKRHFIDFYKQGCFIIETKQGVNGDTVVTEKKSGAVASTKEHSVHVGHGKRGNLQYDQAMIKAHAQADRYARAIAAEDGWVPFIIVCDVGYRLDVYADFSGKGHHYVQFPDRENFRIHLDDLVDDSIRERLRMIWNDPHSLNSELQQTKVTKDIADQLAILGQSLESQGHAPKAVADFIMRFVFSMFAENVGLIPESKFSNTLKDMHLESKNVHLILQEIWQAMDTGNFSMAIHRDMKKFNGSLFKDTQALELDQEQLDLLIHASTFSWKDIEPAILGTLLEHALDKVERGKLGAHYTPRAYVEQLVVPTVIDPLRLDWVAVQAIVNQHMKVGNSKQALKIVRKYHKKLCETRVLDPACGSGNFLYVTFEHMKKLEGEVTALLEELGDPRKKLGLAGQVVSPSQFLGIEKSPWAASIAELVLWIGYLQQHYRIFKNIPPAEPVMRDFHNIEQRDAILDWDKMVTKKVRQGQKTTHVDKQRSNAGRSATEQTSESDKQQVEDYQYINPKRANWPNADFIVGNPPFIGDKFRRAKLGDGYNEALVKAYSHIARNKDFVMYWWDISAKKVSAGETKRFGLITTDSITQTNNSKIVDKHLKNKKTPISIHFAIADHPWINDPDSANVRIAMTVGVAGKSKGRLTTITDEEEKRTLKMNEQKFELVSELGIINADLTIGTDVQLASPLLASEGISSQGMLLVGKGFKVTEEKAIELGMNVVPRLDYYLKPYRNGKDLAQYSRNLYLINMSELSESEVRTQFPAVYQHLWDNVKSERVLNQDDHLRTNWWKIARPRTEIQPALENLDRYIVTPETTKHRFFQFFPSEWWADNAVIMIASDDAMHLAVLSSRIHVAWAYANRGQRGIGPRYHKIRNFDTFPFPELTPANTNELRDLGEQLNSHRATQLERFPELTMTNMYNVREKYRAKVKLTKAEETVYNWGVVSILDDIHNKIDDAVARAYGWSNSLSDNEIVSNLVQLNLQRKREEDQGEIKWLRPDYQIPQFSEKIQPTSPVNRRMVSSSNAYKRKWPKTIEDRLVALMTTLFELQEATPDTLAKQFKNVQVTTVKKLLSMLDDIGAVISTETGSFKSNQNV